MWWQTSSWKVLPKTDPVDPPVVRVRWKATCYMRGMVGFKLNNQSHRINPWPGKKTVPFDRWSNLWNPWRTRSINIIFCHWSYGKLKFHAIRWRLCWMLTMAGGGMLPLRRLSGISQRQKLIKSRDETHVVFWQEAAWSPNRRDTVDGSEIPNNHLGYIKPSN